MAIGYGRVDTISRSRGQSICARMAYIFRTVIVDPRTYRKHSYARTTDDVEATGLVGWNGDASSFATAAAAAETRGNACEGRSAIFALPHELDADSRLRVVQESCREINAIHGVALAFAIHRPDPHGSRLNWHVHLIISSRRTHDGMTFGEKARELDSAKTGGPALVVWREKIWAKYCDEELKRNGSEAHVDMRSWRRRLVIAGLEPELIEPYEHLGPARSAVERKGRITEAGRRNRLRRFYRQIFEPVSRVQDRPRPSTSFMLKGRQAQRAIKRARRALDSVFDELHQTSKQNRRPDPER